MRNTLIATILSLVIVAGCIGSMPVFGAETKATFDVQLSTAEKSMRHIGETAPNKTTKSEYDADKEITKRMRYIEGNVLCVGSCGDTVSYIVSAPTPYSDLVLTIFGYGSIWDYDEDTEWEEYRLEIGTIVIEEGITSIGENAFYGFHYLSNVTIPEGVTKIGNSAFFDCKYLNDVTIPNSVTSIGDFAFAGSQGFNNLTIPKGVKSIGKAAFMSCYFSNLEIPSGVKFIGEYAFFGCFFLKSVTIPSSVTQIEPFAFAECYDLTDVAILGRMTSVGDNAFYNDQNLTLYAYSDSFAELHAKANKIDFVCFDEANEDNKNNIETTYTPYGTYALQAASTGCYITCDVGAKDDKYRYSNMDDPALNANATRIGNYEQFELVPCKDGNYALRSVVNRCYLSFNWERKYDPIQNRYYIVETLSCNSDFVQNGTTSDLSLGSIIPLTLTKGASGVIKFKGIKRWLCVKNGKLSVTNNENEAEVFNQILVNDNHYTEEEISVLTSDEWFNLYDFGKGFYDIQHDVGIYNNNNAQTLQSEEFGYTLMNEEGKFERDYIELGNMQCFVAYKKLDDYYDVIIAIQGTAGFSTGDAMSDAVYNASDTKTDDDGFHKGYHEMTKKLINNETRIMNYKKNVSLSQLITYAQNDKAHFTILGHSMGGAIAQCYAVYLSGRGIPKNKITGRTFNSALACDYNDKGFTDWYNLCVSTDSVCNGLVPGSIKYYGIHRIGKTIWLYDDDPENIVCDDFWNERANIANNKHNLDRCLHTILADIYEKNKCDHVWGAKKPIVVATETKDGEHIYTCPKCGQHKVEKTQAFGGIEVIGLETKTYTGKEITQPITIKLGDNVLEEYIDYEVSYQNNVEAGIAKVVITGKGDYSGTVTKLFTILP